MKYAIYPERQNGTPTATSTNASPTYAWSNLIDDDSRKKVGKAADGVQSVTLRQAISANSEAITVHGTNAETVICTITLDSAEVQLTDGQPAVDLGGGLVKIPAGGHGLSEGDVALINGTDEYDGVYTLPTQAAGDASNFVITATYAAETFSNTDTVCEVVESTTHDLASYKNLDRFWQIYTEQTGAHTATIKLTAGTGETAEAGILRAGLLTTIGNPLKKPKEKPKSYGVSEPLRNGASYGKSGEIVRTFSYSMLLDRTGEYRDLMELYRLYDPFPLAMLITDNVSDSGGNEFAVFGRIVGEPDSVMETNELNMVSIYIEEVV